MGDDVELGEVTGPSGQLVVIDAGHLGLWSGDRSPDELPDAETAVDLEVVGPDAAAAARSFDRQSGRHLYDVPGTGVRRLTALFDAHVRVLGLTASLRPFDQRVPHRERVRRAVTAGDADLTVSGIAVVALGDVPVDRALPVTATTDDEGRRVIRVGLRDGRTTGTRRLGAVRVEHGRILLADADALAHWVHEEPVDGLADLVLWGGDEVPVAAELGVPRTPDGSYGWLDLPIREARVRAAALTARREARPRRLFAFELRPHSHHWAAMAGVRASEHGSAALRVGGATVLMVATAADGYLPVLLETGPDGEPRTFRVTGDG